MVPLSAQSIKADKSTISVLFDHKHPVGTSVTTNEVIELCPTWSKAYVLISVACMPRLV